MSAEPSQPFCAGNFIKYHPVIKQELGSHNAALLFDRLEYWFSKMNNQFYKFIKPCDHPLYKQGDSWEEELGLSHKAFRNAFDRIGIRYKSKTEFKRAGDPFKGKLFAYYQDRQSKRTIFVRNHDLLKVWYENLKAKLGEITQKINTKIKAKVTKTQKGQNVSDRDSIEKGLPTETSQGRPHVGATKDKQISTSFRHENSNQENRKEEDLAEKHELSKTILKSWRTIIGDHQLPILTERTIQKIHKQFTTVFKGSLTVFEAHCHKIASSQFLMGEKSSKYSEKRYELRFWVALSESFVDDLSSDVFETGTRVNKHFEQQEKQREQQRAEEDLVQSMAGHNHHEQDHSGQEKQRSLVNQLRMYFINNHWKLYKSVIQPAEITQVDKTIHIKCITTWATNYLQNECVSLLETLKNQMKVNVNVA